MNVSDAVPIRVENFSTEPGFDFLSFSCKAFSGQVGPDAGLVQKMSCDFPGCLEARQASERSEHSALGKPETAIVEKRRFVPRCRCGVGMPKDPIRCLTPLLRQELRMG